MGTNPSLLAPDAGRVGGAVLLLVAFIAPVIATLWVSTPDVSDVQVRLEALVHRQGGTVLAPDQVPSVLANAVIATEDERFYSHHGIDTVGLARAGIYDLVNRCMCQGGSTITQQLVKALYLNGSDRGRDKITDMVLALKVEQILNKQQIMAGYLSEIATGLGRYGVAEAACAYFGAPLSGLSLGQYALLAGVTQAPSLYDPTVDPDAATTRRGQVLADMVANNFITQAQADAADAEPILVANRTAATC